MFELKSMIFFFLLKLCLCINKVTSHFYIFFNYVSNTIVRGVCNFLGSVSLQQKFEVMDRSVLQLGFTWQAKENTSLRCEGRQNWEEKRSQRLNFGSSFYVLYEHMFYMFFLYILPLSLSYANWASQEAVCFTWGAHSGPWAFLCPIFTGFSLLCLLATTVIDSFFLF